MILSALQHAPATLSNMHRFAHAVVRQFENTVQNDIISTRQIIVREYILEKMRQSTSVVRGLAVGLLPVTWF